MFQDRNSSARLNAIYDSSTAVQMPTILACVNLKGGVGKTAIAVNFAAYCGRKGMRTLLVDCDPQTNATFSCIRGDDWAEHARQYGTIASLLGVKSIAGETNHHDSTTVIKKGVFANVDLVPSHISLFSVDLDLGSAVGRELRLRKALQARTEPVRHGGVRLSAEPDHTDPERARDEHALRGAGSPGLSVHYLGLRC